MEGDFNISGRRLIRKGAWTREEDILLKHCVEKYGEGKWHLVPSRAGLNRCRKSCRLRWMNYLKPDIKKGDFTADEVDLILRIHKLLGNRWALIAGRIPGRTANDVKNYWNTHLKKKVFSNEKKHTRKKNHDINDDSEDNDDVTKIQKSNIIKPRPRTFTTQYQYLPWMNNNNNNTMITTTTTVANKNINLPIRDDNNHVISDPPHVEEESTSKFWWETLLLDDSTDEGIISASTTSTSTGLDDNINRVPNNNINANFSIEVFDQIPKPNNARDSTNTTASASASATLFVEANRHKSWTDFIMDMELWDITTEEDKKL